MAASWGTDWNLDARCQVVHNGLDVTPFQAAIDREAIRVQLGVPPDCTLYLHVGRMIADKNQHRVVAIFAQAFRRNPSARLVLVGQGEERVEHALRESVAALGIRLRSPSRGTPRRALPAASGGPVAVSFARARAFPVSSWKPVRRGCRCLPAICPASLRSPLTSPRCAASRSRPEMPLGVWQPSNFCRPTAESRARQRAWLWPRLPTVPLASTHALGSCAGSGR